MNIFYAILFNFLILLIGYLIGSFNIAIVMSKKLNNEDLRQQNSGNAGATNGLRTYGKKFGLIVFAFDTLKCFIPTLITIIVFNHGLSTFVDKYYLFSHFMGLGIIFGHIFPIYHKFKGGKGVSCTVGFLATLNPIIFVIAAISFFSIFFISRYVSLASILTAVIVIPFTFIPWMILSFSGKWLNVIGFIDITINKSFPISSLWYIQGIIYSIAAIIVIAAHHTNITRLIHKEEKKLYFKKIN